MAHGHFGGMQVACLLWQRVCSEKFPSRTSLSGGFGKEAFLCVPLLLGSKRAVSPKCGHEPIYGSISSLGNDIRQKSKEHIFSSSSMRWRFYASEVANLWSFQQFALFSG